MTLVAGNNLVEALDNADSAFEVISTTHVSGDVIIASPSGNVDIMANVTMPYGATVAGNPSTALGLVPRQYVDAANLGSLRLTSFVQAGDPDDTLALGRMITAWSALPGGGAMLFPTQRETVLSSGVTINIAQGQALILGAEGGKDARLRFTSSFTGTAFTVTESTSSSFSEGPTVRIEGLEFISTWSTTAGTAISITCASGGNVAPAPSCVLQELRFSNAGSGSWALAASHYGMNVTSLRSFYCYGFSSTAVGLSFDTGSTISVVHYIDEFFMNGGGTAIQIGHSGATGPLQGFTITRPNIIGTVNGIVATCASNLDQIIITGGQISTVGPGVSATNVTTPIISDCYFLNCGTAISVSGATRVVISDNVFNLGAPTAIPGNGTNNLAVTIANSGGSSDSGSVVSGNLVTNNYGNTPCVTISGSSNYVHVVGNFALQGTMVSDTSGNPNNTDFGNYVGGGINTIYLGPGTPATKVSLAVSSGNLTLTPASGANVIVSGAFAVTNGTSTSFVATNSSSLNLNVQNLTLLTRPGHADTPQLVFGYNTTGSSSPSLGYNPSIKDFVLYNENGVAITTVDVNGNIAAYGGLTVGSSGPTITTGSGVPSSTQPSGSIYLRTSGSAGARLYVTSGGGTWAAVASV